jgi:acetyl esterase
VKKVPAIILTTLIILFLASCSTIKTEFVRSKMGLSRAELKELKETMDPDTQLSDASAVALYMMNTYMNQDGTFKGQAGPELYGDRETKTVELTNCTLWVVYPKKEKAEGSSLLPVVFYTHGGGYYTGSYLTYQTLIGEFADRLNAAVFFVDYRLAPENKFPAGVEDVWEAYRYLLEHADEYGADASKVALAGDSAGANFAAGLAIRLKENGLEQPSCVVLMYPSLTVEGEIKASHLLFGGFDGRKAMLSGRLMSQILSDYLESPEDAYEPYASPLLMLQGTLKIDNWENEYAQCAVEVEEDGTYVLADHLIQVAGADTLRDDGLMYHAILTTLGTKSTLHTYKNTIHGFVQFYQLIQEGEDALKEACSYIKDHWK